MDRALTNHEMDLAVTIAVDVYEGLIERQKSQVEHGSLGRQQRPSEREARIVYDEGTSNLETSVSALSLFGLVRRVEGENNLWYLLREPHEKIELPTDMKRSGLDALLAALSYNLGYMKDFWRSVDDQDRRIEAVSPSSPSARKLCEALVKCSYMAETTNGDFTWTRKIGPWFVECGNRVLTEFDDLADNEIEAVLRTIPQSAQKRLRDGPEFPPMFVSAFFHHWYGGQWNTKRKEAWFPSDDWNLPIAAGVHRKLFS